MRITPKHHFDDSHTVEFDSPASDETLITPPTGKYVSVKDVFCVSEATSGAVTLKFATSNNTVAKFYMAANKNHYKIGAISIDGAADEVLSMDATTAAGSNYLIIVNYTFE